MDARAYNAHGAPVECASRERNANAERILHERRPRTQRTNAATMS
jgi:hypothetical protein